jgi:hypothetical protein
MKDGFIADLIQVCATMDMRALRIIDGFNCRLVRRSVEALEKEGAETADAVLRHNDPSHHCERR